MKKNIFLAIGLIALALTFAVPVMAVEPKKKIVDIEYETPDQYVVRAKLMYPLEIKKSYPMVVLLHSLGYSSEFWQSLPDAFNQAGFAVLKIDFKGHAEFFSRLTKPTVFLINRLGRKGISRKIGVRKIEKIARSKPCDCLRNISNQTQIVARKPTGRSDQGIFIAEKMLS